MNFSGSYEPSDVSFLLQLLHVENVDIHEKERLIQSGEKHYSEMLSTERPPSDSYLSLFEQAIVLQGERLARHCAQLAAGMLALHPAGKPCAVVSLARAGTPIGVVVKRALVRHGVETRHYSISIIRDRGIDAAALDEIRRDFDDDAIHFVDGWTGKGVITGELRRSIAAYNQNRNAALPARLCVVADLAGSADLAATHEDYLIPSAVLNAVVSGLVSRTVLTDEVARSGGFHGAVYLNELAPWDQSRRYVDALWRKCPEVAEPARPWTESERARLRQTSEQCVTLLMSEFGLVSPHQVKVGIGESTRALLRRLPERLLVRDAAVPGVAHLLHLATQRGVVIEFRPELAYEAAVMIAAVSSDV